MTVEMVSLIMDIQLTFHDKGDYYEISRPEALTLIYNVAPIFRKLRDEKYLGLRLIMPKADECIYFPIIVRKGYKIRITQ